MPESSFDKKKTVIVYILFYMQITTNTVLAIHPEIANLQLILYMQYAGPDFHLEALGCFKLGPFWKIRERCHILRAWRLDVSVTAYCLDTLNVKKKWFSETSIIQRVFYVIFAGKKQPEQVRKMREIRSSILKWWRHLFENFWQKPQILKCRVSVSNSKSRVSVLTFSPCLGLEHWWRMRACNRTPKVLVWWKSGKIPQNPAKISGNLHKLTENLSKNGAPIDTKSFFLEVTSVCCFVFRQVGRIREKFLRNPKNLPARAPMVLKVAVLTTSLVSAYMCAVWVDVSSALTIWFDLVDVVPFVGAIFMCFLKEFLVLGFIHRVRIYVSV